MGIAGIEQFRGMTREQFLGRSKIVTEVPPALAPINLRGAKPEPFLDGKYLAAFSTRGALVYDGDKVIASYWFGAQSVLFVDPGYRRQGIAFELTYQRAVRCGPFYPLSRTQITQAIAVKVFDRIKAELGES